MPKDEPNELFIHLKVVDKSVNSYYFLVSWAGNEANILELFCMIA
jgi:hypothetical protein